MSDLAPDPSVPDWDATNPDQAEDSSGTADDVEITTVDPHPVDEDPEDHIGDEELDPWRDATELAWVDTDADNDESEEQD